MFHPRHPVLYPILAIAALAACRPVAFDITDASCAVEEVCDVGSATKILAYLEDHTMKMNGNNIPTHPQGYDENTNYGAATQCYHDVTLNVADGQFQMISIMGVLEDAPNALDIGTCRNDVVGERFDFTSTSALIENVAGDASCFDATFDFGTFLQEGRGSISADCSQFSLEIFFTGQASGHRCGNGAVGSSSVTFRNEPFTGDAEQKYVIGPKQ